MTFIINMYNANKKFFSYVDITDDGIPFYCGKGNLKRLLYQRRNSKHKGISKKYGIHRLVIFETDDEQETFKYEMILINDCHTFVHDHPENHFACNFTRGGDGITGYRWSEEAKRRQSENSPSRRPEVRKRMSESHTGKKVSQETKEKISKSFTGHIKSEKTCKKIALSKMKPVVQMTKLGEFVARFDSAKEAEKTTGAARSKICGCCKGRRKSANSFTWKYEE